jgi:hypothetical protein
MPDGVGRPEKVALIYKMKKARKRKEKKHFRKGCASIEKPKAVVANSRSRERLEEAHDGLIWKARSGFQYDQPLPDCRQSTDCRCEALMYIGNHYAEEARGN